MRRRSQGVVDLHGEVRAPATGQGRAAARKGRRWRDIRHPGSHRGRHGLPDPGLHCLAADTEGVRQRTQRPANLVQPGQCGRQQVTVPGLTQVAQVGGRRGREGELAEAGHHGGPRNGGPHGSGQPGGGHRFVRAGRRFGRGGGAERPLQARDGHGLGGLIQFGRSRSIRRGIQLARSGARTGPPRTVRHVILQPEDHHLGHRPAFTCQPGLQPPPLVAVQPEGQQPAGPAHRGVTGHDRIRPHGTGQRERWKRS